MKPPQQYVNPNKSPRYPECQDSNEEGLSVLRAQYKNAMNPNLSWGWTSEGTIAIFGGGGSDVEVILRGDRRKITALAELICRAVRLGWYMLNELEPELAGKHREFKMEKRGGG
jgi:hypothetical protein